MDDLLVGCLLTAACLMTMVFTSPGGVLPGFKLKAALFFGTIGIGLVFILKFYQWMDIDLIPSRVEDMMCSWMAMSWAVILIPYSRRVKERLEKLKQIYG